MEIQTITCQHYKKKHTAFSLPWANIFLVFIKMAQNMDEKIKSI